MAKLSRSLFTVAVLLVAGGAAAYLTRDKWQAYAPAWLNAYLPPATGAASSGTPAADGSAGAQGGAGGRRGGRRSFDSGPIPVLTADAKAADVPVTIDGVGTVKAYNTVTITPQVSGQIIELPFREGQDVKKGDVIARIDDSTYKATLDQAIAKKAQDQSLLDNAKRDLERYIGLVASNSVTKQVADTQRALVAQDEAQLKSDDAAIASAQATLAYTVITAPIDGRTGIRSVDAGNVVQASSGTAIVTLSQMKPISLLFNVPQQSLSDIVEANAAGQLQVQALSGSGSKVIDTGTLEVIDNQVDSTTGTIRLKATFPNAAEALWPGAFVNARLLVKMLKGVVVVPTAAVQRGPNGTYLYVLSDDSKAQMRPVTIGQQNDQQAVVTAGLKVGEHVITTGFARLNDGSKVEVTPPAALPAGNPAVGGAPPIGGAPAGNTAPGTGPSTPSSDAPPATDAQGDAAAQGHRHGQHKGHHRQDGGQGGDDQPGESPPANAQPGSAPAAPNTPPAP